MRVAHVITRMIVGGAQENTLLNCLDLINDWGDDVLLITGPSDGPEGKLLEQGRAGDLNIATIPSLQRAIHPRRDAHALKQIKQTLRTYKPDVVHTHSAKGGMLGRAAASSLKIPAILHTVHGAPFYKYQNIVTRNIYKQCELWAAKRCHKFICVADAMTDLMLAAKIADRSKFVTIYSGMEVEPFLNAALYRDPIRIKLGLRDEHIVVGKIARLFELKGHEFVIQAAKKVVAGCPNIRFLFVGDGSLRSTLERQIRDAGLEANFIFVGLVPPDQVPRYVAAMDMLVHTSLREGLARALPQALLAGIPAISYDIDGAREVVLDRQTGRLLQPLSIKPLAEAILELATQPDLRNRWGRAGRQLCQQRFDHHFMTQQIRQLYVELSAAVSL